MKFANLKLFLLCCLLIPVAAFAGSGSENRTGSVRAGSETNCSDPETVVDAAIRKLYARSFRSRGVTTSFFGTSSQEMAYVGADRYQIVSNFENKKGIKSVEEMIVIGKDVFTKKAGQWKKQDEGSSPEDSARTNDQVKELADRNLVVKSVGSDTIGGLGMKVYEVKYTVNEEVDISVKFWIGDEDKLLHRMQTTAKGLPGEEPVEESIEVISTIDFYDFGADIKIEAPV
jgi:hypothetical protein